MIVPFVDLKEQYQLIKKEVGSRFEELLTNSQFVGGEPVTTFEQAFAEWMGVEEVISCGNGTDALEIALEALGIGRGDEVIVPALSWISSSECISTVGAKPVFVDVDAKGLLNPHLITQKLSPHTKAIVVVHLYGHPAEMNQILTIAKAHDLLVIEDCAQAHGAMYQGQKVGSFGHASAFSFYPSKNLGAYGDAGCMWARDASVREKMRRLANHGQLIKNQHPIEGHNSRMDTLQAAVLHIKLKYIDQWNAQRAKIAQRYHTLLRDTPVVCPEVREEYQHIFHLYVIQCDQRDALQVFLSKAGIETSIHYPTALPFLEAYSHLNHSLAEFPQAQSNTSRILSLPMYPELSDEKVRYVAGKIREFFDC
jgi:dTDP-4-amino-4,6-dideoxygalactose transaminase